jgi:hypothetical protein
MSTKRKKRPRKPTTPYVAKPPLERFAPTEYTLRRRAAALAECIKLFPDEIANGLAKHPEAYWCFGQFFLVSLFNDKQYSAAKKLDRTVRQYRRLLHRHGLVEAKNIEMAMSGIGMSSEDLSDQADELAERICNEYNVAVKKLTNAGENVRDAVIEALDKDVITDPVLVLKGLDALITN